MPGIVIRVRTQNAVANTAGIRVFVYFVKIILPVIFLVQLLRNTINCSKYKNNIAEFYRQITRDTSAISTSSFSY